MDDGESGFSRFHFFGLWVGKLTGILQVFRGNSLNQISGYIE